MVFETAVESNKQQLPSLIYTLARKKKKGNGILYEADHTLKLSGSTWIRKFRVQEEYDSSDKKIINTD